MRIYHAAETIKGGIATVMSQLAVAQNEAMGEDRVRFLVPANQSAELRGSDRAQVTTFERKGREPVSFLRFMFAFTRDVLSFKPDVIHLHSTFAGVLGRLALLPMLPFYRPVVIYTPHAWAFLMKGSEAKKSLFALVERLLMPLATVVVCNSRYELNEGLARGLNPAKMHLILHGVAAPQARTTANPYKEGPVNLLFVGRFDEQKGFDLLVEAMRRLEGKNFHLTAVGEGVHATEKPPALPNVTYTGWLKPVQLVPYFAHADVLVMPSRWESFGLVAAEAAAYGLPAVATDCCSLPELVVDGVSGKLFPLDDVDALVRALVDTPAKDWKKMGEAARAHQQKMFSIEKMVAETRDLYVAKTREAAGRA